MLLAIPLLLIPVVLYNIVVLFGAPSGAGMAQADVLLRDPLFSVTMTSGAQWSVTVSSSIPVVALTPRWTSST